jgi:DNA uptake protein ComE-like DNA-binding protein
VPEDKQPVWTWTLGQRRALLALLFGLVIYVGIRLATNRAYVPDPPPPHGARYDEVVDKIDPNSADVPTLAALPLIGEKRAQQIVEYREKRRAELHGRPAFRSEDDLLLMKGFGRASLQTLRPYLVFPSTQPISRP